MVERAAHTRAHPPGTGYPRRRRNKNVIESMNGGGEHTIFLAHVCVGCAARMQKRNFAVLELQRVDYCISNKTGSDSSRPGDTSNHAGHHNH